MIYLFVVNPTNLSDLTYLTSDFRETYSFMLLFKVPRNSKQNLADE